VTPRKLVIRRASLVAFVAWIALLAADFARREFAARTPERLPEVSTSSEATGDVPIRVHKGFVYSDTIGGAPSFRMAAREAVEFASGWYEFRDVQVSLYHQGTVAYGLVTDRLRYNPLRHEAETEGEAQVSLQGGIALRAGGFKLGGTDRALESEGPVTFAGPGWGGIAASARCSLDRNTFSLTGGVSVTWRSGPNSVAPSMVLLAPRLTYDRNTAVVRFPQGVTLLRGQMEGRAARAEVQLSGAEGEVRHLVFFAPVHLDGTLDDGSVLRGVAGDTDITLLANGRLRVAAEPSESSGWVSLHWSGTSVGWRELTAWRLVGEGTRAEWEWLEGQGHACAVEVPNGEDLRSVDAERMRIDFQGGRAQVAHARENVLVEVGDNAARGEDLSFSLTTGTFTLLPAQGGRVALSNPDGSSECDRLSGTEGGGVVAQGQVLGSLVHSSAFGPSAVPVRFAAASATALDGGNRLLLEGDARLWQGERLLRADRLEYDRERETILGQGDVLTTVGAGQSGAKTGSIEVRSRQLTYDRRADVATYQGDVTMVDSHGEATCQRLVATMDEGGRLALASLEDGVTISDRASGRVVSGQRARYLVDQGLLEMWGNPVVVRNVGGDQVKAAHLEWRRPTNTVVVLGNEDNPTETQYHPSSGKPTPRPGQQGRQP
jgi:lipopolysaccharide export system protein LptA